MCLEVFFGVERRRGVWEVRVGRLGRGRGHASNEIQRSFAPRSCCSDVPTTPRFRHVSLCDQRHSFEAGQHPAATHIIIKESADLAGERLGPRDRLEKLEDWPDSSGFVRWRSFRACRKRRSKRSAHIGPQSLARVIGSAKFRRMLHHSYFCESVLHGCFFFHCAKRRQQCLRFRRCAQRRSSSINTLKDEDCVTTVRKARLECPDANAIGSGSFLTRMFLLRSHPDCDRCQCSSDEEAFRAATNIDDGIFDG